MNKIMTYHIECKKRDKNNYDKVTRNSNVLKRMKKA